MSFSNKRSVRFASVSPILCTNTKVSTSAAPGRVRKSRNGPSMDRHTSPRPRLPETTARRTGSPNASAVSMAGKANAAQAMYATSHPARSAIIKASAPAVAEPMRQPYCDMPEPMPSCAGCSVSMR